MSDLDPVLPGHPDAETAASGFSSRPNTTVPVPTAGALLRGAREAEGMHIAALAGLLKIPVKRLEALEQDRFDLLLDAVFVRALASSVCRILKLDAVQVLERLPPSSAPKLTSQGAGINTPFRSSSDGQGPSLGSRVSRPAVLVGLAFLLGALVLIFLPTIKQDAALGYLVAGGSSPGGEPLKLLPAPVVTAELGLVDSTKSVASTQQAGKPVAAATAATTADSPSTGSFTSAAPESTQASVSVPVPTLTLANAAAASADIVTFRAKGESWVEVTDAKGSVLLRRILTAGERASASGALPLAAVVGRADAVQVQVRGQALDLIAVARDNVARFEVK
jgi:cytoskeleton protein RodZ